MAGESRWNTALRRLDRLRVGPSVAAGLLVGGLAGAFLVLSTHPAALVAFTAVLGLATILALTAEPVAEEVAPPKPTGPQPGDERVNPKDGTVLVFVPGGEYTLGADDLEELFVRDYGSENAKSLSSWSEPVHRVRLTDFWIAKHPVTNEQYRRFLDEEGGEEPAYWSDERFNSDRQPVVGVSWDEARAYCRWADLELPSEAQWEAAARGTDGRRYPWGDEEPDTSRACFGQDRDSGKPEVVGKYPLGESPFRTLDQAGNVWEWCLDTWDEKTYKKRNSAKDPVSTKESSVRVVRGGAWFFPAGSLAAANRAGYGSSDRENRLGFRCAFSVPTEHSL